MDHWISLTQYPFAKDSDTTCSDPSLQLNNSIIPTHRRRCNMVGWSLDRCFVFKPFSITFGCRRCSTLFSSEIDRKHAQEIMGRRKTTSPAHFKQHTREGNDLLSNSCSEILGIYCKIEHPHFAAVPVYTTDTFGISPKCCIVFQFLSRVHIWNLPFQYPGLWMWHKEKVSPNVHKAFAFEPQNHKERKGRSSQVAKLSSFASTIPAT